LVTFIELIKNPRYGFWRKTFTRSAPEMERVFESIARSCLGPNYATIQQQQQAASPAV
jgi:CCR4-NOT transcription complex subunit 1